MIKLSKLPSRSNSSSDYNATNVIVWIIKPDMMPLITPLIYYMTSLARTTLIKSLCKIDVHMPEFPQK